MSVLASVVTAATGGGVFSNLSAEGTISTRTAAPLAPRATATLDAVAAYMNEQTPHVVAVTDEVTVVVDGGNDSEDSCNRAAAVVVDSVEKHHPSLNTGIVLTHLHKVFETLCGS